jgi:hypothetical protein
MFDFGERNSTLSTVDGHWGGIAEFEVRAMTAPTFLRRCFIDGD